MKSAEKNIFIFVIVGILAACSSYLPEERTHWPVNPAEMHSWQPPDETTLSARRANQLRLDVLTSEIEILFVNHATLSRQELAMFKSMLQIDPKINEMDSTYNRRIESEQERKKRMEKDLEMSKAGFLNAEARLKKIMATKKNNRPCFFTYPLLPKKVHLNHVVMVMPKVRYFICVHQKCSRKAKERSIKTSESEEIDTMY